MADLLSSAVAIGGKLLGGLFGKKDKPVTAGANFVSHIDGVMQASEKHNINAATLLGLSPIGPSAGGNGGATMGAAIQDAAMYLADKNANQYEDDLRKQNLELQNELLQKQVVQMGIRAPQAGLYGSAIGAGYSVGGAGSPTESPIWAAEPLMREPTGFAQFDDPNFIGPPGPIETTNALNRQKMKVDPDVYLRLGLKKGDPLFAEDFEAIGGEIYGEGLSMASLGSSLANGQGGPVRPSDPFGSKAQEVEGVLNLLDYLPNGLWESQKSPAQQRANEKARKERQKEGLKLPSGAAPPAFPRSWETNPRVNF